MVLEDDRSELSWTYQTFRVAGATDKYRLTIGGGNGTGHDAMAYHNNQQFSTYDNDNDRYGENCSFNYQGGWWYVSCYLSNLNGPHIQPSIPGISSSAKLMWNNGNGNHDISHAEMKIRPKQCNAVVQEDTTC